MRKYAFFLGLTAVVSSAAVAGPAETAESASAMRQEAVQQLSNLHPGIQFHQEGARITQVYGAPFGTGISPEATAEGFRQNFAAAFGVSPAALDPRGPLEDQRHTLELVFDPATGSYKFTLVYFTQYQDGIPVFRADLRLLVRNEPTFPLVLANSSLRDLGGFTVPKAVVTDPAAARNAAQAKYPAMNAFSNPQQVVWAGYDHIEATPALALQFVGEVVNAPNPESYLKRLFVCDATTGAILYEENLVLDVDITGNVSGVATDWEPLPGADLCNPESTHAMPYAAVSISGGSSTFADANGNFTLSNPGTGAVTVNSPMSGLYFTVVEQSGAAGLPENLSQSVTPPGPANFLHNSANSNALIRAEVNAYIQANVVRDYLLSYVPNYPTIAGQTGFPINTNIAQSCNAFYNGSSINFYQAGGGCSNTANSDVVWHEFGHHIVATGGSGQGAYGEGMSDCVGVLISDQPILGLGFQNNCSAGIRNADNNCQYSAASCSSCGSEIHACGQLISGIVWSIRTNLLASQPATYRNIISSLTLNSVPLHIGTSIDAQIAVDFLTLDDNDGNIGNGTPHRTEICDGFSAHGLSCPALEVGMSVTPEAGFTASGQAGGPFVPDTMNYTVWNLGPTPSMSYNVTAAAPWLTITNPTGTLAVNQTATVTVSLNANANGLVDGDYFDTIQFVNQTDHVGDTTRQATLRVGVNDLCQFAKRACPGVTYTGNTADMTLDGSTTCGTANTAPDAWYKYTPDTNGTAVFSLCSGTTYDAVLSVHSGCPGTSGNTLGCDDDTCAAGGPSQVTLGVTAGATYLIRIAGWSGAVGPYGLTITGPNCGSDALTISLPNGAPGPLQPGVSTEFDVSIQDGNETYVVGSGMLHYRYQAGAFQASALTSLGGNLYRATLPPATCSATPEFYISAQGSGGTTVTNPGDAPNSFYSADMGTAVTILDDMFETDLGWTVGDTGDNATTGLWQRGDPQPTAAQPGDDHTPPPGVNCWATGLASGGSDGANDVDGGKTTLKSPTIDLSGNPNAVVGYWRWYSNSAGGAPNTDVFTVDVSNDNGANWVNAEIVGPAGPGTAGGWFYHEFRVADFVTPTAQVRLRFVASDLGSPSLIEAALDDVQVTAIECTGVPTCPTMLGDTNHDGAVTGVDIQTFVNSILGAFDPCADFNGNQAAEPGDIPGMVNALLSL